MNQTTIQEHQLKTTDVYFDAVARGEKTFEVRRDDRGFQRGDIQVLKRWTGISASAGPHNPHYEPIRKRISYVLTGGQWGIEPGYVVMGLQDV